jgi:hypothetical protein
MLSEDELGEVFRVAVHSLVEDIQPSERLLESLDPRHGAGKRGRKLAIPRRKQATPRRIPRPRALVATILLVGAIVAGTLSELGGSALSESYAVTIEPGGAVEITLYQMSGAGGANSRLRALGVRAAIVPIRDGCRTKIDLTYISGAIRPAGRFRLLKNQIPVGTTIVLAARLVGSNRAEEAIGQVTGPPPTCVAPGPKGPFVGEITTPTPSPSTNPTTSTSKGS